MSRAWLLTLPLAVTACGSPPPAAPVARSVVPMVPSPEEPVVAPDADPAPDSCEGHPPVRIDVDPLVFTCPEGFRACGWDLRHRVLSCGHRPLRLVRAKMSVTGSEWTWLRDYDHAVLRRGEVRSESSRVLREGRYTIVVLVVDDETNESHELNASVDAFNPERDAAIAACTACQGTWGSWGMTGFEGCNCATRDAGTECRDGEDCEGSCLFDRFDVVQPASKRCDAAGACGVTIGTGVPVGKCSAQRMVFGCKSVVPDGASREPPVRLPGRAPHRCVD
jgi:hypothetical protein